MCLETTPFCTDSSSVQTAEAYISSAWRCSTGMQTALICWILFLSWAVISVPKLSLSSCKVKVQNHRTHHDDRANFSHNAYKKVQKCPKYWRMNLLFVDLLSWTLASGTQLTSRGVDFKSFAACSKQHLVEHQDRVKLDELAA